MNIEFSQDELKKVELIKKKYPNSQSALMPVLYLTQEKYVWISFEAIKFVSKLLSISEEHILGVVTFYTMYNRHPIGKFHIQVCTNVSCMLRGAYELMQQITDELGIKKGETTSDNKFTLTEVECLGSCGTAPTIQINDDYYENLNKDTLKQLISNLKKQ
ncbi:MAG: NADH-quinone oxidoreductase subunit NuoE [Ignavibacteria bacterium]|nr:NADH-quinone oxidoreductase subunit NuoE [Ignavibacteria bacterium]